MGAYRGPSSSPWYSWCSLAVLPVGMQSTPRSSFWELPSAAGDVGLTWIVNCCRARSDGCRLCYGASSRGRVPALMTQHSTRWGKKRESCKNVLSNEPSVYSYLNSIVVSSLIPVVVIIVRLSLRLSSGTSTSVTVAHLLRSP